MTAASHQTIKLGKGKHSSPQHGACVMELASMLAGEPFTDHPQSVCPVIASLLRAYNDAADDERRQNLYAVAAEVVGTRGSVEVQDARAARLAEWTAQRRRRLQSLLPGRLSMIRLAGVPALDSTARQAVRSITRHTDHAHRELQVVLDDLLAIAAQANGRCRADQRATRLESGVVISIENPPGIRSR